MDAAEKTTIWQHDNWPALRYDAGAVGPVLAGARRAQGLVEGKLAALGCEQKLELAAEANTNFSGVLCGRATWKEGIPVYAKQGIKALEDWLSTQGVANIKNVNTRLAAAKPWFSFYGVPSVAELVR